MSARIISGSTTVTMDWMTVGDVNHLTDAKGIGALLAKVAESFRVIPISPEIARIALEPDLPHGDPSDRVIAATAKIHSAPLLTRDRSITASESVTTLW